MMEWREVASRSLDKKLGGENEYASQPDEGNTLEGFKYLQLKPSVLSASISLGVFLQSPNGVCDVSDKYSQTQLQ